MRLGYRLLYMHTAWYQKWNSTRPFPSSILKNRLICNISQFLCACPRSLFILLCKNLFCIYSIFTAFRILFALPGLRKSSRSRQHSTFFVVVVALANNEDEVQFLKPIEEIPYCFAYVCVCVRCWSIQCCNFLDYIRLLFKRTGERTLRKYVRWTGRKNLGRPQKNRKRKCFEVFFLVRFAQVLF